jgi:hypothetical protein
MRNKMLFMVSLFLFVVQTRSNAQPPNAKFYLFNTSDTATDVAISIRIGCTEPMAFLGYLPIISNDTFYIKGLWVFSACFFGSTYNRDTIRNAELPTGINYINVSTNFRSYNESTQTYDTTWNVKDSTFVLHPVGIDGLSKNVPRIAVYPNPANNTLFFEQGLEYRQVQLYNSIGQHVATYSYNNTGSIDISTLAKGFYFLKLNGKKEETLGWARFVKTE